MLKNGEEKFVENLKSWWSEIFGGLFFSPHYCTLCCDHLGELADVTFADAWLRDIVRNDKVGTSIVVARNTKARELLEAAASNNLIHLDPLDCVDVIRSQIGPVLFKKRNVRARINIRTALGLEVPDNLLENKISFLRPTIPDYLVVPLVYLNLFTSGNRLLRFILKYTPFCILRLYRFIFRQMFVYKRKQSFVKSSSNE